MPDACINCPCGACEEPCSCASGRCEKCGCKVLILSKRKTTDGLEKCDLEALRFRLEGKGHTFQDSPYRCDRCGNSLDFLYNQEEGVLKMKEVAKRMGAGYQEPVCDPDRPNGFPRVSKER
jgi:hypothetical protein